LWVFGDGTTSTEENPSHNFTMPGTYVVNLTTSNDCGNDDFSLVVNILAAPTASINALPLEGCVPLTVQYSGETSDLVDTWSWSFPGGIPSNSSEQNPQVVYANSGVYAADLMVANAAGSNSISTTNPIQVDTLPSAQFSFSVDGNTVTFTSSVVNAAEYLWNFGDGTTSTAINPVHQFSSGGTYTVTLNTSNDCGNADAVVLSVEVEDAFTVAFAANFTEACAPFVFDFTDLSSPGATTWNWSFPGGNPENSTEQNPTVVYTTPGVYSVSLEAGNGLQSSVFSEVDYLTLIEIPLAGFDYTVDGNIVSFTNNSINGITYEWDFGDGTPFNTDENPVHEFVPGIYTVSLAVSNGLCSSFISQTIDVNSTATHELTDGHQLSIFPNPTQGLINVSMDRNINRALNYQLLSTDGKILLSESFAVGSDFVIDVTHLPTSIYLLKIEYNGQRVLERILKY
ncbi:MAG: PKD domain-containing protein, partial [Bacteroidota bacterium]